MDEFEKQSGSLDVVTASMDDAMSNATSQMTPSNQVNDLIAEVAAENGLEVTHMMQEPSTANPNAAASRNLSIQENEDLQRRLANLRA